MTYTNNQQEWDARFEASEKPFDQEEKTTTEEIKQAIVDINELYVELVEQGDFEVSNTPPVELEVILESLLSSERQRMVEKVEKWSPSFEYEFSDNEEQHEKEKNLLFTALKSAKDQALSVLTDKEELKAKE